jgi:hypothetical protein
MHQWGNDREHHASMYLLSKQGVCSEPAETTIHLRACTCPLHNAPVADALWWQRKRRRLML